MASVAVHLLDVGSERYGDAVVCQLGGVSVLIDGAHPGNYKAKDGHPSLQSQIASLLEQPGPGVHVDLLIATHAHQDHIGCLPHLVDKGLLTADWALLTDPGFGWGRVAGSGPDVDAGADQRARQLFAALREEPRTGPDVDDAELDAFFADAMTLEDRYLKMIEQLESAGTRIVRYGRDSHDALVAHLAENDVGLEILGPRVDDLLVSAEAILNQTKDMMRTFDAVVRQDPKFDLRRTYRTLVEAVDASRLGHMVNIQSIVTLFTHGEQSVLFTGDVQLEAPGTGNVTLTEGMRLLRENIEQRAPFDFVKLAHHGSHNGFSEEILEEMQTPRVLGICAGERSTKHPSEEVLELLEKHTDELTWARTDRNGLVSIWFDDDGEPTIDPERGETNDPRVNTDDDPAPVKAPERQPPARPPESPERQPPMAPEVRVEPATGHVIEVVARIPNVATRVALTIDVQPGGEPTAEARTVGDPRVARVVAGRQPARLDGLLFVTDRRALVRNLGQPAADRVVGAVEQRGGRVRNLQAFGRQATDVANELWSDSSEARGLRGVVLLGGYDVIPPQRLDVLTPTLRTQVRVADPDDFVVWSDDTYGDVDRYGPPELPVSRIPDASDEGFVVTALDATTDGTTGSRSGVRNVERPFAESVYRELPGAEPLLVSRPTVYSATPEPNLGSKRVYLMLHGDDRDGSRFWGEGIVTEAVNVSNIHDRSPGVVLAGCCWGALVGDPPAGQVRDGRAPRPRAAETSMALSFLAAGANAFVGCTGAHYSPTVPPFGYFGGPFHDAFWRAYAVSGSAARALFEAKRDYLEAIPHQRDEAGPSSQAIEHKIARQFTCLGLGW